MFSIEALFPFTSVMIMMIITVHILLIKQKIVPKETLIQIGILYAFLILLGIVYPAYQMITGHRLFEFIQTETYWNLTELGIEDCALL